MWRNSAKSADLWFIGGIHVGSVSYSACPTHIGILILLPHPLSNDFFVKRLIVLVLGTCFQHSLHFDIMETYTALFSLPCSAGCQALTYCTVRCTGSDEYYRNRKPIRDKIWRMRKQWTPGSLFPLPSPLESLGTRLSINIHTYIQKMSFVYLLVSLQWNKKHNTVKISKCLLSKLEALYVCILVYV